MNLNINKNYFGKVFFLIGVLIFIVMIFSPLNNLVIHIDEFFTLAVIKFSIGDIIKININDVHPPLYYLILKVITKVLTSLNIQYNTLFVLKMVSIIPYGLILLFSATKLQKEYGWLTVGIFVLSLACLSEFFMYFIIARMYSFGLLFLLISFYAYKNILESSDKKSWVLFTVFSVLGAYTHYFVAISSLVLYLMLFIFVLKNKESFKVEIRKYILSVISGIILYAPWVLSLFNQMDYVQKYFWIKDLTLNDFIQCLSFFATGNELLIIEIVAILSLIFFIVVLFKQYDDFDNNENYFILSGFCVFIGTILLGTILSIIYKPILITRYLIPASAVVWLSISILVGKIKNNKLLLISVILIVLLCVSGVNDVINSNDGLLHQANHYDKVLNDVNHDADIIIINSEYGLLEFSDYLKDADIYTVKFGDIYGVDNKHVHEIYNFKELNSTQLSDLIENSTNKSIYFLDVGGPEKLDKFNKTQKGKFKSDLIFYKLK